MAANQHLAPKLFPKNGRNFFSGRSATRARCSRCNFRPKPPKFRFGPRIGLEIVSNPRDRNKNFSLKNFLGQSNRRPVNLNIYTLWFLPSWNTWFRLRLVLSTEGIQTFTQFQREEKTFTNIFIRNKKLFTDEFSTFNYSCNL